LKEKSAALKGALTKESKDFSGRSTLYGEKNEDVPYTGQDIVWISPITFW
jgi:hypothetical protein